MWLSHQKPARTSMHNGAMHTRKITHLSSKPFFKEASLKSIYHLIHLLTGVDSLKMFCFITVAPTVYATCVCLQYSRKFLHLYRVMPQSINLFILKGEVMKYRITPTARQANINGI